jgi:Bacterial Ig-like domain (group 3)
VIVTGSWVRCGDGPQVPAGCPLPLAPRGARSSTSGGGVPVASIVGQTVIFTATVAPASGRGTPGGTVTFTIDGKAGSPVPLSEADGKDQATLTLPALAAGSYTITASYSGDSIFDPSNDGTAPHGLTNTFGQLLEGADSGRPDSDYRTALTWRNLVLDPLPKGMWRWARRKTGNANLNSAAAQAG